VQLAKCLHQGSEIKIQILQQRQIRSAYVNIYILQHNEEIAKTVPIIVCEKLNRRQAVVR
jgi:hypothetical protein